jgi:hypothetical protein
MQHASAGVNARVRFNIYNNTVEALNQPSSLPFRHAYDGTYQPGDTTIALTNNIFIVRRTDHASGLYGMTFTGGSQPVSSDKNLVYIPSIGTEQSVIKGGSTYTWTEWKALGYDARSIGVTVDPLLNADNTPKTNSPVINVGADLSAVFTADATQTIRRNGTWSIGAFNSPSSSSIPRNMRIQ